MNVADATVVHGVHLLAVMTVPGDRNVCLSRWLGRLPRLHFGCGMREPTLELR